MIAGNTISRRLHDRHKKKGSIREAKERVNNLNTKYRTPQKTKSLYTALKLLTNNKNIREESNLVNNRVNARKMLGNADVSYLVHPIA